MFNNIDAQIKNIKEDLTEFQSVTDDNINSMVVHICNAIEGSVKRRMKDTKINEAVTYYSGLHNGIKHHPSIAGNAPAVDTGTLRQSYTHDIEKHGTVTVGHVGSILQNPPYAEELENGTSKVAARPVLGPATEAIIKSVNKRLMAVVTNVTATIEDESENA